ncbi:hypothetical protein [Streptomyces sp. NPDC060035]|uniref:hypothetical protein n=1 Tax=Streptomyces sp. NPDC060035 TaxID=3347044 RepID=UPI0036C26AD6
MRTLMRAAAPSSAFDVRRWHHDDVRFASTETNVDGAWGEVSVDFVRSGYRRVGQRESDRRLQSRYRRTDILTVDPSERRELPPESVHERIVLSQCPDVAEKGDRNAPGGSGQGVVAGRPLENRGSPRTPRDCPRTPVRAAYARTGISAPGPRAVEQVGNSPRGGLFEDIVQVGQHRLRLALR